MRSIPSGANAETILLVLPAALTGLLNLVEATATDASFSVKVAPCIARLSSLKLLLRER